MYKLLNQITALALVPHVMSRQLKTDDSSKDWIELNDSQVKEYADAGGLFLKPGQVITLGLKYDVGSYGTWRKWHGDCNEAWTIEEEIDEK